MSIYEKFMSKVEITDSCWNWIGTRNSPTGPGQFCILGEKYLAHRVSWMMDTGLSPEGRLITQTCGNIVCVHPEHLEAQELEREPSPYDG